MQRQYCGSEACQLQMYTSVQTHGSENVHTCSNESTCIMSWSMDSVLSAVDLHKTDLIVTINFVFHELPFERLWFSYVCIEKGLFEEAC